MTLQIANEMSLDQIAAGYGRVPPLCKARAINMDPVAVDAQQSDEASEIYASLAA